MPQTSQEVHDETVRILGTDEDMEIHAHNYLINRGWLYRRGFWKTPTNKDRTLISHNEWRVLQYLIEEWDESLV